MYLVHANIAPQTHLGQFLMCKTTSQYMRCTWTKFYTYHKYLDNDTIQIFVPLNTP